MFNKSVSQTTFVIIKKTAGRYYSRLKARTNIACCYDIFITEIEHICGWIQRHIKDPVEDL